MEKQIKSNRIFSLDLLRVAACFLVINQHASEYYYIGEGSSVVTDVNTFWIGIITSLGRISVPLFIMISGYFLLPMKNTTSTFFRKRFTRVVYPFLFWCVAFAVYYVFSRGDSWQQMLTNILNIPVNFGTQVGHLWYIYMLLGLYLVVPILSPWLEKCSKKELQGYLWIWAFTTLVPYIHRLFPEILGECYWNPTPMLYYFTGFIGYFILGYYIKAYGALSVPKSMILIIIGYVVTSYLFCSRINTAKDIPDLELSWSFCSLNVVMMTYGLFSLFKAISYSGTNIVSRILSDISAKSYGMYLLHIMVLNFYYALFGKMFSSILITVPLITLCTFITTYIIIRIMSYLPGSKYWLGITKYHIRRVWTDKKESIV